MRAVVTGCAGFIGSTWPSGWSPTAGTWSASTRSPLLRPGGQGGNLAGLADEPRFDLVRPTSATTHLDALLADRPVVVPPRRPAGRARQLRRRLRPVRARQRARHPAPVRGRPRRRLPAGRVRLVVVGVRRRGRRSLLRGHHADRPRSPYGVTKRACENLADVYRELGLEAVGLRYFTVYGPRQRPDMAIRRLCEAATRRDRRSRSTATAASRATSRTSPTPSTPRCGPCSASDPGSAPQRRRRPRGLDGARSSSCSASWPARRPGQSRSGAQAGDVAAPAADTDAGAAAARLAPGGRARRRPRGRSWTGSARPPGRRPARRPRARRAGVVSRAAAARRRRRSGLCRAAAGHARRRRRPRRHRLRRRRSTGSSGSPPGESFVEDVAAADASQAALATGPLPRHRQPASAARASTSPSSPCRPRCDEGAPDLATSSRRPRRSAPFVRAGLPRRAGVDDLPGHHRDAARPAPRGRVGPARRHRLLPSATARSGSTRATAMWTLETHARRSCPASTRRRWRATDAFYRTIVDRRRCRCRSTRAAELAKLLENTFRHVNIALVNELAMFAADLGIDVWEAIDAAATKPFGFMRFTPGPGRRRALPADRPELPVVDGAAAARPVVPVRRAGQRHQRPHARLRASRGWSRALNRQGLALSRARVLRARPGLQAQLQRRPRVAGGRGWSSHLAASAAPTSPWPTRTSSRTCLHPTSRTACRAVAGRAGARPTPSSWSPTTTRSTTTWSAARRATSSTPATGWRAPMSSTSESQPRSDARRTRCPGWPSCVSGWPRVSETFALNELLALHRAGHAGRASSPPSRASRGRRQPGAAELEPLVDVLPAGDRRRAGRRSSRPALAGTGRPACTATSPTSPPRSPPRAAERLGVPYGFSVHALDARKVDAGRAARPGPRGAPSSSPATPTSPPTVAAAGAAPRLRPPRRRPRRVPRATAPPGGRRCELLAVGRLVEKKGFDVLLDGAARGSSAPCRLRIVGDGPLRARPRARPSPRSASATGRARRPAHPRRAPGRCTPRADVVVVPSVVDARAATATGCPTSCSRRWPAAARWSPATSPRSPPPSATASPACSCRRATRGAGRGDHRAGRRPDLRRRLGARARPSRREPVRPARLHRRVCAALEQAYG